MQPDVRMCPPEWEDLGAWAPQSLGNGVLYYLVCTLDPRFNGTSGK